MSGSRQYDKAFDVCNEVSSDIKHIVGQCNANVSAGTRYNGLSVLRKIRKTICLSSNDTLGHEVQKHFSFSHTLEDGMLAIIGSMTPEERLKIRQDESSSESLWPKLVELNNLAQDYCVFDKLEEVLDLLEGGYNGEYDEEEAEGEEEADDNDQEEEEEIDEREQWKW